jgi:hypothetical protein
VAVTYYDFRNNTSDPGLPTDLWMVHAHPADGLTNPASWTSENRMTPVSFDMEMAPVRAGYFLGDYQGLVAEGKNFGAFFSMTTATDSASVFFRDPLPEESGTLIGSRDPGQPLAPGGNSTPVSLVTFAGVTLPFFGKIEAENVPVMTNAGSLSQNPRPYSLLSAVTSWLPSPEVDSGAGRYLLNNSAQHVSFDWRAGPVTDGFVTDLMAQDVAAPLTGL